MAAAAQVRRFSALAGGAALLAILFGAHSLFAPPTHDDDFARLPPLVLPGTSGAPAVGHAAPATPDIKRRSDPCGGAQYETVRGPVPTTPPQGWFSSDDYPRLALAAGRTGMTTTDLVIDARGAVIGCGISNSSGHFSLDSTTCAVFQQRARFNPAEDARGCPVPSVWHQRVRWVIGPIAPLASTPLPK